MPSQHLRLGFHSYIRNLKLNDFNPRKITLVIGADVPEPFILQDNKKKQLVKLISRKMTWNA